MCNLCVAPTVGCDFFVLECEVCRQIELDLIESRNEE